MRLDEMLDCLWDSTLHAQILLLKYFPTFGVDDSGCFKSIVNFQASEILLLELNITSKYIS